MLHEPTQNKRGTKKLIQKGGERIASFSYLGWVKPHGPEDSAQLPRVNCPVSVLVKYHKGVPETCIACEKSSVHYLSAP
jgi:hypothetical protein